MRVKGNFFDLLDAGLAFCFKHLNLSGKITNRSLQREERLEIPYKALREAIINSLCHRQWEKYNLLNSIAIYDDRVEIGNPGILPSQITPKISRSLTTPTLIMSRWQKRSTVLCGWKTGDQEQNA